ncbi:MAG: hypothetical protein FWD69_13325 [Polyangiaceae bacterium]|nr:hypothetical protein [Polyangiaceae bacterium]
MECRRSLLVLLAVVCSAASACDTGIPLSSASTPSGAEEDASIPSTQVPQPASQDPSPSDAGAATSGTGVPSDASVPEISVTDAPDTGCNLPALQTGFVGTQTFSFRSEDRTYSLYIADNYDGRTNFPVILMFHGDGGTGDLLRSTTQMEGAANGTMIFVYPDGKNKTWDIDDPPETNEDYPFVDALVEDIAKKLCIDRTRIFGWGLSKGGFFVNYLGCFRGDLVRGVVAHSAGGPSSTDPDHYDSQGYYICPTTTSALNIHGDLDTIVPLTSAIDSRNHWIWADGCSATSHTLPSGCVSYDDCAPGRVVEWCELPNQDHGFWDGATQVSLDFFNFFK